MIERGDEVTLHYALRLEDGTVIESTFDAGPETFRFGSGEFPLYLERRLRDLDIGATREFRIPAEAAAFGAWDPTNRQRLDAGLFSGMALEPGALVEFEVPSGDWVRGRIEAIDGDGVTVDFNDPLIGRNVDCRVELLNVKRPESTS